MTQKLPPHALQSLDRLKSDSDVFEESLNLPSLDDELDSLAALLPAEEPESEEEFYPDVQEQIRGDVLKLLADRKDAPTQEQIQRWKDQLGEGAVQLLGLDQDNVYIYTHITLGQWEKIQSLTQQVQPGTPQAMQLEKAIKERVIRSAVLWPKLDVDFFQKCRAGLADTLYTLIMVQSYFLTPQQALTLTTQL